VEQIQKITATELKSTLGIAGLFAIRMLGLFMVLPVFALYEDAIMGAQAQWIGLAIGIYGLTQAALQIPLGVLSDRIGRKPVILMGLAVFALGSLIASQAETIFGLIAGRALQGAGAIGSTLLALVADVTRETVRTRAMAIIGISIGVSFIVAMILGPFIDAKVGLHGIFATIFLLSLVCIVWSFFALPKHTKQNYFSQESSLFSQFVLVLKNQNLRRLNLSVLFLHAAFSSCFLFIPSLILKISQVPQVGMWRFYFPVLVCSLLLMAPFVRIADSVRHIKKMLVLGILGLALSVGIMGVYPLSLWSLSVILVVFFAAFNLLEALLPSWVSKVAPKNNRGMTLGVYSTAQFFGVFLGGAVGGMLYEALGVFAITLWCSVLFLLWLVFVIDLKSEQVVENV